MTTKARDSTGAVRTADTFRARDVGSVLRTADFIRVRGPDGVLREVFTRVAGGGGTAPASNPTYITPGETNTSNRTAANTAYFMAASSGTAPSAFTWGVLDGAGLVVSGGATASAQLRVTTSVQNEPESATFFCDMVVSSVTYRATCSMTHTRTGSGMIA